MDFDLHSSLTALRQCIEQQLDDGQAYSEHELIRQLQQQEVLAQGSLRDSLGLFRCHFVVMHCLYQLQQHWRSQQQADLHISPLQIQKQPWQAAAHTSQSLHSHDPLAEYYLDLDNLQTERADIEQMLDGFWQRFVAAPQVRADLALLELPDNASQQQVRLQYKRLAMRYHPDRGGDPVQFRAITQAFERLKIRFG